MMEEIRMHYQLIDGENGVRSMVMEGNKEEVKDFVTKAIERHEAEHEARQKDAGETIDMFPHYFLCLTTFGPDGEDMEYSRMPLVEMRTMLNMLNESDSPVRIEEKQNNG